MVPSLSRLSNLPVYFHHCCLSPGPGHHHLSERSQQPGSFKPCPRSRFLTPHWLHRDHRLQPKLHGPVTRVLCDTTQAVSPAATATAYPGFGHHDSPWVSCLQASIQQCLLPGKTSPLSAWPITSQFCPIFSRAVLLTNCGPIFPSLGRCLLQPGPCCPQPVSSNATIYHFSKCVATPVLRASRVSLPVTCTAARLYR